MGIIKVGSLTRLLLITGGSAGIGLSTASRFLSDDYTVVCLSRRPCPLKGVQHLRCDLAQPDFLETIRPALEPLLSQADCISVIHNASRLSNDTAINTPSDEFRDVLEINIVAPNTLNRFVIPFMKRGSSVLFVGSTLSEKAVPGLHQREELALTELLQVSRWRRGRGRHLQSLERKKRCRRRGRLDDAYEPSHEPIERSTEVSRTRT